MGLILDTDVVIAAERRGHTVRHFLEYIQSRHGDVDLAVSVVTIAELMHGAYRAKSPEHRRRRLAFIDQLCADIPVHPFTLRIAMRVGRIDGEQASKGIAIAFEDLVIGATALQAGYDVATLNVRHFDRIPDLRIVTL